MTANRTEMQVTLDEDSLDNEDDRDEDDLADIVEACTSATSVSSLLQEPTSDDIILPAHIW